MSSFDAYHAGYGEAVDRSIAFTGLKHDVFLKAKADVLAEELRARGREPAALSLLDVGCGVGELHRWLTPVFGRVEGTDPSEPCLARARLRNPEAAYRPCREGVLPYAAGAFDVVLATCVLHHVPAAERAGFAAEMKRVLKPGGLACVIEHNPFNPLTRLSVLRCPFDADAVLLRDRSAERLLRAAGLTGARSRHFLLTPWSSRAARAAERALQRLPIGAQYATFATA